MPASAVPLLSLGDVLRRIAEILRLDAAEIARSSMRVLGVWLLAFLAYRLLGVMAARIERVVDDGDDTVTSLRERRGRTIAQLLQGVGRVVIVTVALLLTFNIFIDIGPILAGAGILGLAISFGAQSLVKDVISGFFILFENQFAIGDVIEVVGKSGVVEKMSLRAVSLRDIYGVMHIVPNGEIKVVSNKTRGWARAVVDVAVARDVDIDKALEAIRDEAARFSNDAEWKDQLDGPVEVLGVESVTDNSVIIRSLIRTKPGSQWNAGREFRRRLVARLHRDELDVPWPERKPLRTDGLSPTAGTPPAPGTATVTATAGPPRG